MEDQNKGKYYYPFGLTMSGISDRALQFGKYNRYQYNGIELDTSLGLDDYETKLRELDPQTGRWWQVDPKIEKGQENLSPYASNFDDPIRYDDPNDDCPACEEIAQSVEEFVDQTAEATDPETGLVVHAVGAVVVGGALATDWISRNIDLNAGSSGSMTLIPSSMNQHLTDWSSSTASTTTATLAVDLSGHNPNATVQPANLVVKQMHANVQAKANAQKSPGQTAAGHPTDKYGNRVMPSGETQVNRVRHSSEKKAKDAARNEGNGAPEKHQSPAKGQRHYHPTQEGKKIPNSTHHEY